ncbi:Coiled-coil domain-containing protein 28B [Clonorchis sinensis]|uniref:Coiled-coil domain-containing protein 28B n=1 Tax=Clonorchis sinensis TaxID=79923 RepID=A0A8T1M752_CLOSI|nr:Coiled-coil domain-containing protein 28B [Clonorchis sinensis]
MAHDQTTSAKKEDHASSTKENTFAIHVEDVQRMESRLLKLLDDFNSEKMLSFGPNCPYEKLNAIRDQQEDLMRLHFEQDKKMQALIESGSRRGRKPVQSLISDEGWKTTKSNVDALITKLEALSSDIHNLHKPGHPS